MGWMETRRRAYRAKRVFKGCQYRVASPAFLGGRRVRGRRRWLRAFAELPDQRAELFGGHYLRFLAVDKGGRRGVDAVLLRERDVLIHLCGGLTFHYMRHSIPRKHTSPQECS